MKRRHNKGTINHKLLLFVALLLMGLVGYGLGTIGLFTGAMGDSRATVTEEKSSDREHSSISGTKWDRFEGYGFTVNVPTQLGTKEEPFRGGPTYKHGGATLVFAPSDNEIVLSKAIKPKALTLEKALGYGPYKRYPREALLGKRFEKFMIDGVEGLGVTDVSGYAAIDVIWIKGDEIYEMTTNNADYVDDVREMLKSFKFGTLPSSS